MEIFIIGVVALFIEAGLYLFKTGTIYARHETIIDDEEDTTKAPELKEIKDINANVFLKNQTPEAILFRHCNVLIDDLKSIKEHNCDVGDLKEYIQTNYGKLLKNFYLIFKANNNTLIDFLYNTYGIALWKDRKDDQIVYAKIDNVVISL